MMMRALDAGGIPAIHSPDRDRAVRGNSSMIPGYDPNPHGFYEVSDLRAVDWSNAGGKCVKVIRDNLIDLLPSGEYRAVYMRRDPAEIRRSYLGTMSGPPTEHTFNFLLDYDRTVAADVALLAERGAKAVALDYASVVRDPSGELSRLGWPIDVGAAAATVDAALYRHRGAA